MMILISKIKRACLFGVLGLVIASMSAQPVSAAGDSSDGWEFSADIYAWMPAIKGETTTGKDLDVSFSDILDKLDFTYMGGFKARKGKFSLLVDVVYMDVKDTSDATIHQGNLVNLSITNVNIKSWVVTPAMTYDVLQLDRLKVSLLVGAQYFYLKATTDFQEKGPLTTSKSSVSGSTDYWNGIVGAMGQLSVNEKWFLPFNGFVGTGDTDLTWQVFGGVGYKFSNLDLIAGYRHLEWDFDSNDRGGKVMDDLYISGPMIGIRYYF